MRACDSASCLSWNHWSRLRAPRARASPRRTSSTARSCSSPPRPRPRTTTTSPSAAPWPQWALFLRQHVASQTQRACTIASARGSLPSWWEASPSAVRTPKRRQRASPPRRAMRAWEARRRRRAQSSWRSSAMPQPSAAPWRVSRSRPRLLQRGAGALGARSTRGGRLRRTSGTCSRRCSSTRTGSSRRSSSSPCSRRSLRCLSRAATRRSG
mmetsp:Transcript_23110/g.72196  ORF Transcript_23110/g.72196 Transcript_23110/m.72196 type:complete len:212 (+) Transcript_23110:1461-2096(+)